MCDVEAIVGRLFPTCLLYAYRVSCQLGGARSHRMPGLQTCAILLTVGAILWHTACNKLRTRKTMNRASTGRTCSQRASAGESGAAAAPGNGPGSRGLNKLRRRRHRYQGARGLEAHQSDARLGGLRQSGAVHAAQPGWHREELASSLYGDEAFLCLRTGGLKWQRENAF